MVRRPDLGPRHVRVLGELREGPLSVGEIAKRLGIELSTASQLTGELRRARMLRAERDPNDSRRVLVSTRLDVQREVTEFFERWIDPMRQALSALSEVEREAFVKGLRLWVSALPSPTAASTEHASAQGSRRAAARGQRRG